MGGEVDQATARGRLMPWTCSPGSTPAATLFGSGAEPVPQPVSQRKQQDRHQPRSPPDVFAGTSAMACDGSSGLGHHSWVLFVGIVTVCFIGARQGATFHQIE